MSTNIKLVIAGIVTLFGFILAIILSPFATVDTGTRGVVKHWSGDVEDVALAEGFHWISPFDSVTEMDIRTQVFQVESSAATKDLQTVTTKVALNFHLKPDSVVTVYRNIGINYLNSFIAPALQESVKAATSQFTAEELITKRDLVREETKKNLVEKLTVIGFAIDDFNVVDFDFSAQFNAAIESKVTAEQSALAAKNKLEQVKFEAEQRVAQARAEAEAIRISASAINSQGGADYVQLQAIAKWNGTLPNQFIPGMSMPFIGLK